MAKVTITYAAKLAGISRAHLYNKFIKTGVLSVDRDNQDKPCIDTSELVRVFGGKLNTSSDTNKNTVIDTLNTDEYHASLQALIASKDEELRRAWEMVAWLQAKIDSMETKLLQGPETRHRWWWPW